MAANGEGSFARRMSRMVPSGMSSRVGPKSMLDVEDDFEGPELVAKRMRLVLPHAPWKVAWDWVVIALVLYNAYMVPFDIAFGICGGGGLLALDIIVDLFFIADLFLNLRTTFVDHGGMLVLDYARVRRHYLTSWFAVDFLSAFPFEYIFLAAIGRSPLDCSDSSAISQGVQSATLMKVARLLRLGRLAKKFEKLAAAKAFRVIQLTVGLLMIAHWFACIWYLVGVNSSPLDEETKYGPGSNGTSWIYRLDLDEESLHVKYAISIYWALTMVMKSPWLPPNSMGEFALASFMALLGSVLFAYFVGNVTAVVSSTTQKASQFRDTLSGLRTWAVANHLPHGTAKKLLTYYEAMHTERKGFNTQDMLKHIPAHMLPKVLLEFYEPLLTAASFLHELSLSGCIDVLQRLRVDVCDIGDELIIAGTIPRTLYILWRGELQVDFPTLEPGERLTVAEYLEASEKGLPEHLRRSSTSQADSHKARKRGPQGRLDRPGTLIGFDTVFLKPQPVLYAAKAKMRCTVFAIGREELRSIMGNHRDDLPIWIKAVKHGQNILNGRRNLQAEQPSPEQKRAAATEGRMGRRGSNLPEVEGKSMESTLAAVSLPGDSSGQILTTKVEELERTVTEISEAVASQTDILKTLMEDRDGPGP